MAGHAGDLEIPPEQALAAIRRTAEEWGAEFQPSGSGGMLRLPVLAGIRRGLVTGTVEIQPAPEGSRVAFLPESSIYYVQTAPVMVLLLAAAGGLLTVLWPFYPELIAVAPFGAILALGGWFLVISRLRTSGPDEFLATVAVAAEAGTGDLN